MTNPYLDGDKAYNLELYLRSIVKQPHVLFIGEAPGYHGCAKTGIPFTSHVQLQYGVHPIIDAMLPRIKVCNDNDSESTATCFWKTMKKYDIKPCMWNVFPFHPHESGNQIKNRTPSAQEIEEGYAYLKMLLEFLPYDCIVAVGSKADVLLTQKNIKHLHVRHPARGGQIIFDRQIGKEFGGNYK